MTARREPDERVIPNLDPEDWEQALEWRPLAYQTIRGFVEHVLNRPGSVTYRGRFGESSAIAARAGMTSFQWSVSGGLAFGVDPVSLCQDLEYRALEATAVAIHDFDPEKGGEYLSTKYLRKVILRALQSEFDRWVITSSSPNVVSYGSAANPILPEGVDEPSYLDPHDQEPNDGLTEADREKLQTALGALTSKQAWALRMKADGVDIDVIAERLGFKTVSAVHKFIRQARETGQKAYEAK